MGKRFQYCLTFVIAQTTEQGPLSCPLDAELEAAIEKGKEKNQGRTENSKDYLITTDILWLQRCALYIPECIQLSCELATV